MNIANTLLPILTKKSIHNWRIGKKMKQEDLILKYKLEREKLFTLYDCIVSFLNKNGVKVSFANLEHIIETDIYKVERTIKEEDKHHESCVSDGKELWQHENMEDVGGIC